MAEPAGLARAGIGARGSAPTPSFLGTASFTVLSAGDFIRRSQSMAHHSFMAAITVDIMDTSITSANFTDPMDMVLSLAVDFMLAEFPAAASMEEVADFTAAVAVITKNNREPGLKLSSRVHVIWTL